MTTESSSSDTGQEVKTSDLRERYRKCTNVINSDELDVYLEKCDLMDIVILKDRCNAPYILVGSKDDKSSREWIRYRGETEEQLTKFVEWRAASKALQCRSIEELNEFRLTVFAVARLALKLKLDEEVANGIYDYVVVATATDWYCRDNGVELDYHNLTEEQLDKITPYSLQVNECIGQLIEILSAVKMNTSSERSKPNADDNGAAAQGSSGQPSPQE